MFWFSGICSLCAEGVDGPGVEAGSIQEPARRAVSGGQAGAEGGSTAASGVQARPCS